MERGCNGGSGGVKVTFIETQFVTSDAAGFKSLVQRLTGNDDAVAGPPPAPIQRPRPCWAVDGWRVAGGADGPRGGGKGCHGGVGRRAAVPLPPPATWVDEMMLSETCDLAEMLCGAVDVGAGGGYGGFPF